MTVVRLAGADDIESVASMVADAFADDPAWGFMLGPGNVPGMRTFARALLVPRMRRGTAWVADDCSAVAMWDRCAPIASPPDEEDMVRWAAAREEIGEEAWARVTAYEDAVRAAAPDRPYWYLGVLATHPSAQGRGLASAVLQPGFAAAAADGWDCWLETSTPGNKAFYAGRGFTDGREVDIPGGPPTWWLRRHANGQ